MYSKETRALVGFSNAKFCRFANRLDPSGYSHPAKPMQPATSLCSGPLIFTPLEDQLSPPYDPLSPPYDPLALPYDPLAPPYDPLSSLPCACDPLSPPYDPLSPPYDPLALSQDK